LGAAWRERLGLARQALEGWPAQRYGFDRWEGSGELAAGEISEESLACWIRDNWPKP